MPFALGNIQYSILEDSFFAPELQRIEARIESVPDAEIPALFRDIPLDLFALLIMGDHGRFPRIAARFPRVPDDETIMRYTGDSGLSLLAKSTGVVRSLVEHYRVLGAKPLEQSRVLDYGLGWARLLRLFLKYVPASAIHGADAWAQALDLCRSLGVTSPLERVAEMPTAPPFAGRKFDLIYTFSIFTHLSEPAHKAVLACFREALAEDGVLVVTLRPEGFWDVKKGAFAPAEKHAEHRQKGFSFLDIGVRAPSGETIYGDTSISADYVRTHWTDWSLAAVDYSLNDNMQTPLFLKKR